MSSAMSKPSSNVASVKLVGLLELAIGSGEGGLLAPLLLCESGLAMNAFLTGCYEPRLAPNKSALPCFSVTRFPLDTELS